MHDFGPLLDLVDLDRRNVHLVASIGGQVEGLDGEEAAGGWPSFTVICHHILNCKLATLGHSFMDRRA